MFRTSKLTITALVGLLAGTAGLVQAQQAGTFSVRAGFTQIAPDVTSGDLSAPSFQGTKVDIDEANQFTGGITYMWTDRWAIDIPLAAQGFLHEIQGAGAIAGVGKIGEVRALPITALLQYRFNEPNAKWRPYVGGGVTYAKFYKARSTAALSGLTGGTPSNPTTLSVESKLAPTLQAGMTVAYQGPWFFDIAVSKTFLKNENKLSTGQVIETKLDPWAFMVGVGYTF